MTRRMRVLMTMTAAATVLGLAAPALAIVPATIPLGASEGVRYKKASVPLPPDELGYGMTVGAPAFCDDGWRSVGGGQSTDPRASGGIADSWVPGESYWHTSAWQTYDLETQLTTFAICMKTDEVSEVDVIASDLPAGSPVRRRALCSEGAAVSGGVSITGDPPHFRLNASYPVDGGDADTVPDDGWRSRVAYTGAGGDSIRSTVHCLSGVTLSYRTTTVKLEPAGWRAASAVCPKGSAVVGGGANVSGAESSSRLYASRPWDSKDAGTVPEDGWRVGSRNISTSALTMTVHAVCKVSG